MVKRVSLLAAVSRNRVIGYQQRLPWNLPADLQHFREITWDKTVIMGRKTWESLPRVLPRRQNIVVSRNASLLTPGATLVRSIKEAFALASSEIFVIGGADLYQQTLPLAHRLFLTEVQVEVPGDVFFPEINAGEWIEISRQSFEGKPAFDFVVYTSMRIARKGC